MELYMFKKSHLSILALLLITVNFPVAAFAGTVIKIQDADEMTTMLTDGKRARVNISADEYVIVDFASQKINMVNPRKQQVMVFNTKKNANSGQHSTGASRSLVKLALNYKGKTKNIAGYRSDKYEYSANGKNCGVVYASKNALQAQGVKQLLNAMQAMIDQQRDVMGGFVAMIDDCKLADMQLTEKINEIGVPMQREENGHVTTQVKSIDVGVPLPADIFVVPASYKNTTIEEQIQQAYQGVTKGAPGVAPTQPQMQQLQQSGQLTPEMIEQMRSARKMMQQYQRPGY